MQRLLAGLALDGHRVRYGAMLGDAGMMDLSAYCAKVQTATGRDWRCSVDAAEQAVAEGCDLREVVCLAAEEIIEALEGAILTRMPMPH